MKIYLNAGHDRLLVVPGQGGAVVGAATLGPVAVGETSLDAKGRVHGADGLAGLGRVDGERLAFLDLAGGVS